MSFEQDQALVPAAIRTSNEDIDWVNLIGATVRLRIADEAVAKPIASTIEDNARVAFSQNTAKEVLAHPKELVVFHERSQNDESLTFYSFTAVIPDSDEPFDYHFEPTVNAKNERLLPYNFGLFLNPAEVNKGSKTIAANQQIAFNDSNSNSTVWMGAGSPQDERCPDAVFKKPSTVVAVGNAAIAQLFTELADEKISLREKLFGAAIYLGTLALDFDAPLLAIPELQPEAEKQLQLLSSKHEIAKRLVFLDDVFIEILINADSRVGLDRIRLKNEAQKVLEGSNHDFLLNIDPDLAWPSLDDELFGMQSSQSSALLNSLNAEKTKHQRRLAVYERYSQILTALRG